MRTVGGRGSQGSLNPCPCPHRPGSDLEAWDTGARPGRCFSPGAPWVEERGEEGAPPGCGLASAVPFLLAQGRGEGWQEEGQQEWCVEAWPGTAPPLHTPARPLLP